MQFREQHYPARECFTVSISIFDDIETQRTILAVDQLFDNERGSTLRYAFSPCRAVSYRLIEDCLTTLGLAFINAVRIRYGVQEELELALSSESPQECPQERPRG